MSRDIKTQNTYRWQQAISVPRIPTRFDIYERTEYVWEGIASTQNRHTAVLLVRLLREEAERLELGHA